jgi:3-mercaptopropionate dioxygenase
VTVPGMDTPASPLARCLAELTLLAERTELDEAGRLAVATVALRNLISTDDWLDDAFAQPGTEYYQQYLLYCDPLRRFSMVSFVWGPGQKTPIHDHTVWGLVGVMRGAEIAKSFILGDGRLVEINEARHERGTVAAVSPMIGDIHEVRNAFDDRVSISIHVYGGDIGQIKRHVYSQDGVVKPFVSGYSNGYLPNVWGQS